MDPKLSAAIKSAFSVWLNAAMAELKRHPEQKAELKKAMDGDGDVRGIVSSGKARLIGARLREWCNLRSQR
jgi:hypothetical protein